MFGDSIREINPFQSSGLSGSTLSTATTSSSYIVPEGDGTFLEVEEAEVIPEGSLASSTTPFLRTSSSSALGNSQVHGREDNSYVEIDDLHSSIGRVSPGTFTEQRAQGSLKAFEERVQNTLNHKLEESNPSKKKRLFETFGLKGKECLL